ncbi:MAG: hypothetical protein K9L59_08005 [Desulfobacterales bacterium]|nr:hypothetical protein [Desulfobacterales bacterium]MCF8080234.1 hypothetical protein [Desulfobacterales bacterium]
MMRTLKNRLARLWRTADEVAREKAVETVSHEVTELENIFALLVLGMFVGIPSPPIQITLDLMPDMEREFDLMLSKVATAHDPLGELFSVLDID